MEDKNNYDFVHELSEYNIFQWRNDIYSINPYFTHDTEIGKPTMLSVFKKRGEKLLEYKYHAYDDINVTKDILKYPRLIGMLGFIPKEILNHLEIFAQYPPMLTTYDTNHVSDKQITTICTLLYKKWGFDKVMNDLINYTSKFYISQKMIVYGYKVSLEKQNKLYNVIFTLIYGKDLASIISLYH